jgi:outer membrane protein TolC
MRKIINGFKFFLSALLALTVGHVSGQDAGQSGQPQQLSLQQAIEYAYAHQAGMMNARIDVEMAESKVKEVAGIGLPQISGSFDVQDFEIIPTVVFPDFTNPSVNNALQFGTQWNSTAALNASQILFNPSYLVGLQASKSYRELSQKNIVRTRIETNVAVSKAYYNMLVSNERIKLLVANVDRVKKLKDDTEAMYKNGFVEKIDLDRITLKSLVGTANTVGIN